MRCKGQFRESFVQSPQFDRYWLSSREPHTSSKISYIFSLKFKHINKAGKRACVYTNYRIAN
jgi:hypothetical protein